MMGDRSLRTSSVSIGATQKATKPLVEGFFKTTTTTPKGYFISSATIHVCRKPLETRCSNGGIRKMNSKTTATGRRNSMFEKHGVW